MTRTNQRIDRMTRQRKTVFRSATSPLAVCGFALFTGCQSLVGPLDVGGAGPVGQVTAEDADSSANPVVQVSAESTIAEKTKQATTQVMNFVTGREQENDSRSQQLYQEADTLFRQASSQPKDQAQPVQTLQ
jgi:hypothetical protein